ncbi:MAG: hypothetical protein AB1486_28520 [Planctomycetota bacterium]
MPGSHTPFVEVALEDNRLECDRLAVDDSPEALVGEAPPAIAMVARLAAVRRDEERDEAARGRGKLRVTIAHPGE